MAVSSCLQRLQVSTLASCWVQLGYELFQTCFCMKKTTKLVITNSIYTVIQIHYCPRSLTKVGSKPKKVRGRDVDPGLEIYISRQWTIGPPVLEIWWSCQISGGPDVVNRQYFFVKRNIEQNFTFSCTRHLNNSCIYQIFNETFFLWWVF